MYLLIDLSEFDQIHLSIFNEDTLFDFNKSGRNRELLGAVDEFLKDKKIDKNDIKGVMTVVGEGSFTNTRISATLANVFGYQLQIPIMAISKNQVSRVQDMIAELQKVRVGQYVSAKYSAEPNIG